MKQFKTLDHCRQLRKTPTTVEGIVWSILRGKNIGGLKFRRQHPIVHGCNDGRNLLYIVDFICTSIRLVIELDGEIHKTTKEYDTDRDQFLEKLGYKVIRLNNEATSGT